MEILQIILFSSLVGALSNSWILIVLFFVYFKYRMRVTTDSSVISSVLKEITLASLFDEDDKPSEYLFKFKPFILGRLYPKGTDAKQTLFLFCSNDTFELFKNSKNKSDLEKPKEKLLKYVEKIGTVKYNISFKPRPYKPKEIVLRSNQREIIEKIKDTFDVKESCIAYITGSPGSGKTELSRGLALDLNAHYIDQLELDRAGHNFTEIYNDLAPTKVAPLIVTFNEIDGLIYRMIKQDIVDHKHAEIDVRNKSNWNNLLDAIDNGQFRFTIFILTPNVAPDIIDNLDSSLLRKDRVDLRLVL
jgi:hypothetical protein